MELVAYVRVSKIGDREGDSFQSPDEQRRAIDSIVALTPGAHVKCDFSDLDESGGSMDRPGVQQAIAMVENGQADGIVCAYLDRWARNMDALEMIERWTKQGKTFISARERFDASTSAGRLTLGMMLLVAKYYRDRIAENWDASVRNAVERGVHVTVPYGYRRGDGNGKAHAKGGTRGAPLVVETATGDIVRRVFGERVAGAGISAIAADLNADGIPSPRGGRWTRQAVRALLRVRAYTGEASRGEHIQQGAHEPIVSRETWEAAQTKRGRSPRNGDSLLVGLVRCAGCGYVMGAGDNGRGQRRYNCNRHHAELRCPSPTTAPAEAVERLVTDWFLARYGSVSVQGASSTDPLVSRVETNLERARTEYTRWRDDAEMRQVLGDDDYRAGLIARKRAMTGAERAYDEAVRAAKSSALSINESVWATLDQRERRELLRAGIDAVVLRRASSTHTPLADRVEMTWAGELEHDGTRSGVAAAVRGRP
jgi:DNA invertase Pin-like site-specific DNA recombinase